MSEFIPIVLTSASITAGAISAFVIGYIKLRERMVALETKGIDNKELDNIRECLKSLTNRVEVLNDKVSSMQVINDLWKSTLQNAMIDILHHDNTPDRDVLLDKFRDGTISIDELKKLRDVLHDIIKTDTKKDERLAAGLLYVGVIEKLNNTLKQSEEIAKQCNFNSLKYKLGHV